MDEKLQSGFGSCRYKPFCIYRNSPASTRHSRKALKPNCGYGSCRHKLSYILFRREKYNIPYSRIALRQPRPDTCRKHIYRHSSLRPGLFLRAAYQIRRAFTAQTVSRIIGTNPVNRLHRITVQFGISLVLALLAGVNCIILIIFTKAGIAAVFGAEETDGGGLIGLVGLFKLKGGLRFGCVCVCMCRKAGGNG